MTENKEKKKQPNLELINAKSSETIESSTDTGSSTSSSGTSTSSSGTSTSSSGTSTSSSGTSTSSSGTSTSSSGTSTSSSGTSISSSSSSSYNENYQEELKNDFEKINCDNENFYSNECNKFYLKKEILERNYLEKNPDDNSYLYPNLNDKNFNVKIATKKEFNDTKYDGTIYSNIQEEADRLANADFELSPHQTFVKNFMSFQTPYSSLLLYHGLGSGKTCSAIGVCEEMRDYMKQIGMVKRIIIVASENVQDNFKLQLFDERKLKEIDGVWNIRSCTGNKLLQEINPMSMKGIPKEKVISQIKNLINTYYIFLGYIQFANYIIKTINYDEEIEKQHNNNNNNKNKKPGEKNKIQMLKDVQIKLNSRIIKRLQNEFNNRLIVLDEVHNIRKTDDNENKKVAINLEFLIKSALNMRFVLLSATPMYNSYKEIVWLLNLMNTNDRRARIEVKDIFDKNGNFKKNGEEMLIRKATGYISFVRGENPYTFPYRVYPSEFAKDNTFSKIDYPSYQMNLKKIKHEDKKRVLSLYLTTIRDCENCGKCQFCAYKYIIYNLRNKSFSITTKTGDVRDMPNFENMESFGYTLLQTPLESLIISYPMAGLKDILDQIPDEKLSEEFSQSFSESITEDDEAELNEESPGPVEEVSEEEDSSSLSKFVVKTKNKKLFVIEDTDTESNEEPPKPVEKVLEEKDPTSSKFVVKTKNKKLFVIEDTDTESNEEPPKPVEKVLEEKDPTSSKFVVKTKNKKLFVIEDTDDDINSLKSSGGKNSDETLVKKRSLNIDSHQLTGKLGLDRMMNYVDQKSPPIKGNFEYKKSTIDNYGKIFSQKEIGKYSAKIKTILDNIYNPDTNIIGEGIILIYSQYLDSGLIPMALALEEMGFTRYGESGIKPLFKDRPSELVDVRTMRPPQDKKNFIPARYSMITGETRLSPNNDFEVKGLTGDDNKYGNKVKVVLISKAGSEGIDFKFIRQVHILEPWYNMNRIEQIIGRAVRNFSHKDLPFKNRNVQIFMYGTILGKNQEEAADLYVYRVAEYKAIQIGKVTRVLKETAVDCIINHDQTNFTQTILDKKLKEPITQQLSSGKVLQVKIGDAPFSPACDYMADCNFNCRPDKDINEDELNEDTYSENFIIMNSEKILQRIRMLMKEEFFYKKDVLLRLIRAVKEYPYVQIFSALTQLIEDENEFIIDKYGRNGRLINIGEYYLFQPIELSYKNASIFDRTIPIDYKHDMIEFEIKKNIGKQINDKRNVNANVIQENDVLTFTEGKKLVDELKENLMICNEFSKPNQKVPRGDENWFKHCGIVIKKMSKEYPDSKDNLIPFIVAHVIELLLYDEKLEVMNYLYSLNSIKKDTIEWLAKDYFEKNSITTESETFFIMYNLNEKTSMKVDEKTSMKLDEITLMKLDETNKWIKAEPEDKRELVEYLNKLVNDNAKNNNKPFIVEQAEDIMKFDIKHYNKDVGFIGYDKNNKHLLFKTKDVTKRDTGAACSQATKSKNLVKLNEILGEEKYTTENTKTEKDAKGKIIKEAVGNVELCVMEEFILRHFDRTKREGKRWFLTPEMAILHKLYKIFV